MPETTNTKVHGNTVTMEDVYAARDRLADDVTASPMIRLNVPVDEGVKVYLKLENLQPVGSFKLRGAANLLRSVPGERLQREGVVTVSSGNLGHAVAWMTQQLGVSCHVVMPDHVPQTKMAGALRYGAKVTRVPWQEWWSYVDGSKKPDFPGVFIHPDAHDEILAGNGTLGLEILDQVPDIDTVLVPYGGGAVAAGVGTVLKALRPGCQVIACEPNTAAALTEAFKQGKPTPVTYHKSFVDSIGGNCVLDHMWDVVKNIVDKPVAVGLEVIREAVRLLADRHHVIAEGAGAATTAAVLAGHLPPGAKNVVCIVSGGNIDSDILADILIDDKKL